MDIEKASREELIAALTKLGREHLKLQEELARLKSPPSFMNIPPAATGDEFNG